MDSELFLFWSSSKKKTINLIDQDVDPTACIEFTNFYLSLTNNSWRAVVSQSLTATLPE